MNIYEVAALLDLKPTRGDGIAGYWFLPCSVDKFSTHKAWRHYNSKRMQYQLYRRQLPYTIRIDYILYDIHELVRLAKGMRK